MNAKLLAVLGLVPLLTGCDGVLVVERPYYRRPPPVVVYQPAPVVVAQPAPVVVAQPAPVVVVQPAPAFVEEGAVVGGVVVVEPVGMADYVLIDGGWYYWHPGLHLWVHARRPANWRPSGGARVYRNWGEHPMYRH